MKHLLNLKNKEKLISATITIAFVLLVLLRFPSAYNWLFSIGNSLPFYEYLSTLKFENWYENIFPKGSLLFLIVVRIWLSLMILFTLPSVFVSIVLKSWSNFSEYVANILAPLTALALMLIFAWIFGTTGESEKSTTFMTIICFLITGSMLDMTIVYKKKIKKLFGIIETDDIDQVEKV